MSTITPPLGSGPDNTLNGNFLDNTIIGDHTVKSRNLALTLSGDQYLGAPAFTLLVDGVPIAGPIDVTAVKDNNETQVFNFNIQDIGPNSKISLLFENDLSTGVDGEDRNIYLEDVSLDGVSLNNDRNRYVYGNTVSNGTDQIFAVGTVSYDLSDYRADLAAAFAYGNDWINASFGEDVVHGDSGQYLNPGNIVSLTLGGDKYQGDAEFRLVVDGQVIDGTQTVTADARNNETQTFDFHVPEITKDSVIGVQFLNDNYGGSQLLDRNLIINKVEVDGVEVDLKHGEYLVGGFRPTPFANGRMPRNGVVNFDLSKDQAIEDLFTAGGNDELYGSFQDDILYGENGDDILNGGTEDDILYGGRGNDTLLGRNDNDTLIGGLGDDTLDGFIGNDTFVFREGDGNDVIKNFGISEKSPFGKDVIQLLSYGTNMAYTLVSDGTDTTINFGGGSILVEGISSTAKVDAQIITASV